MLCNDSIIHFRAQSKFFPKHRSFEDGTQLVGGQFRSYKKGIHNVS